MRIFKYILHNRGLPHNSASVVYAPHLRIFISVLLGLMLLGGMAANVNAAGENLAKPTIGTAIAGKNYQILKKFGKTKVPPSKVEVVEFFWYGCPHCYRMEPYLEKWAASKQPYVSFRRVAAPFGGLWNIHAQTYYTAERLKVVRKTHIPFFDAIHKEKRALTTQRSISKFFGEYGVDVNQFNEVFSSFSVTSRLRLAEREISFYGINSVPSIVVNGKYLITVQMAGSEANLIEVIKQLAKLENDNKGEEKNKPKS